MKKLGLLILALTINFLGQAQINKSTDINKKSGSHHHKEDSTDVGKDTLVNIDSNGKSQMEGISSKEIDELNTNIRKAKSNLGPIKTFASSTPPRIIRYDLYIADTIVAFG